MLKQVTRIVGEVKREACVYSDELEMLTFDVSNGITTESIECVPFVKGTDLNEWLKVWVEA